MCATRRFDTRVQLFRCIVRITVLIVSISVGQLEESKW